MPNPSGFGDGSSGTVAMTQFNTALISGPNPALLDLSSLNIGPLSQVTDSYLIKASADGSHIYCVVLFDRPVHICNPERWTFRSPVY